MKLTAYDADYEDAFSLSPMLSLSCEYQIALGLANPLLLDLYQGQRYSGDGRHLLQLLGKDLDMNCHKSELALLEIRSDLELQAR